MPDISVRVDDTPFAQLRDLARAQTPPGTPESLISRLIIEYLTILGNPMDPPMCPRCGVDHYEQVGLLSWKCEFCDLKVTRRGQGTLENPIVWSTVKPEPPMPEEKQALYEADLHQLIAEARSYNDMRHAEKGTTRPSPPSPEQPETD